MHHLALTPPPATSVGKRQLGYVVASIDTVLVLVDAAEAYCRQISRVPERRPLSHMAGFLWLDA